MKQAAAHTTTNTHGGDAPFSVASLGLQFLDTTWRIAVPVLLFVAGGLYIDRRAGSKPWATLLAMCLGFAMAGVLVKRQIAAVQAKEFRK